MKNQNNDTEEYDGEQEYNEMLQKMNSSSEYQKFATLVNDFFSTLDEQYHVLAKRDWTCCTTCGHSEIWDLYHETPNNNYSGYIFYHDQERDRIWDNIEDGEKEISVHLQWGLFDETNDYENINKHQLFVNRLIECAEKINNKQKRISVVGGDINKTIIMTVNLEYDLDHNDQLDIEEDKEDKEIKDDDDHKMKFVSI